MRLFFILMIIFITPSCTKLTQPESQIISSLANTNILPFHPIMKDVWGEWKLVGHFQEGIGPSIKVKPNSVIDKNIKIDSSGYSFLGQRCNITKVEWFGTSMGHKALLNQPVPQEYKIEIMAIHKMRLQCGYIPKQFESEIGHFFPASINIHYGENQKIITFQPSYGPEFILESVKN